MGQLRTANKRHKRAVTLAAQVRKPATPVRDDDAATTGANG
ncbi:hypothetical protein [Sphingomonas solaris]|nr:hypothetical protein [Sphingomonas solaris]